MDSAASPAPTPGLRRQTSGGMTDADHSVSLKPMARRAPLNECPEAGTTPPPSSKEKKRRRTSVRYRLRLHGFRGHLLRTRRDQPVLYSLCPEFLLASFAQRGKEPPRKPAAVTGSPSHPPLCFHSREWAALHFTVGKNESVWFLSQVPGRSPLKLCASHKSVSCYAQQVPWITPDFVLTGGSGGPSDGSKAGVMQQPEGWNLPLPQLKGWEGLETESSHIAGDIIRP